MIETRRKQEKVILVAVALDDLEKAERSLDELDELVKTAGAETAGRMVQLRDAIHPGTYIGSGKLDELKWLVWEKEADGIVCDDELSPAQISNLEQVLDCKIMDRTLVILDIFAARASTREGKIQVELAQLKYRQSRLTGLGKSLSRLGGGIGTRGPGEKKLEMDRRLIKSRIAHLNRGIKRGPETPGSDKREKKPESYAGLCADWIYKCGEIHPVKYPDRGRSAGGGQAVRNTGSYHESADSSGKSEDSAHGYGRIYQQASSQPD